MTGCIVNVHRMRRVVEESCGNNGAHTENNEHIKSTNYHRGHKLLLASAWSSL